MKNTWKNQSYERALGLVPDFAFSNDEESIPHVKHDAVTISSNSGTV